MINDLADRLRESPPLRSSYFVAFYLLVTLLIFAALIAPDFVGDTSLSLTVGSVSPSDIRAPTALSYQSQVLTEQRQEMAANAVIPIFSAPDSTIAREQVDRLRAVLNYVTAVREDQFATPEQKLADLAALQDIQLSQETAERILALNEARWQVVRQEAIVVLEQVMRNTIRETQLEEARRSVPALVSLSIPLEQANIAADLASAFVAPNSLFNESLTEAAREQAREAVTPVIRAFAAGEMILERGRLVSAADLEALERFGFLQRQNRWQDLAGSAVLAILATSFYALYFRARPKLARDIRSLSLLTVLFLAFLFGARLTIPGHTIIPYLYPLAAFSLVLASLFGTRYGVLFSLPLSLLAAYGLPNALSLTFFYLFGSIFGVLILARAQRIVTFIWSGVAIAATSAAMIIVFALPDPAMDLFGVATLVGASVLNGVASASLALLLQYFLAQVLGLTTALQLLEISRPDNDLLQVVLRNAAGTYQHSLQVANLAEQAAERIGADPLLTRVGALYHDVGKALNPIFFIENQPAGFQNPHEALSPIESARIILRHVPDGLELARKYRLPKRILDFIREHHGDMITRYQYAQALQAAEGDASQVDKADFMYLGPKPQSRESALVMLADGCEARARAQSPKTEAEVRQIVRDIVDSRLADGQLNFTDLTIRDLNEVVEVFTATMRGIYHPRIDYPSLDLRTVPADSTPRQLESAAQAETLPQADTTN